MSDATSLEQESNPNQSNRRILSLSIRDLSVLCAAYMPFIENGGLFVPTTKQVAMGEEVFLLLSLMEDSEKIPVSGRIVWITPQNPQGKRSPGMGIQFKDSDNPARLRIEELLADRLAQKESTHTM